MAASSKSEAREMVWSDYLSGRITQVRADEMLRVIDSRTDLPEDAPKVGARRG